MGWIILSIFIWVTVFQSCAKAPPELRETIGPATYELRSTNNVDHPAPLPMQTSIVVDWYLNEGVIKSSEGFRAWDMNRDGRFDMLEVLSSDGVTTAWAYDFDGDGRVDLVQATESAGMALLHSSAPIPSHEDASKLMKLSH